MGKKVQLSLINRQTVRGGEATVTRQSAEAEAFEKNGSLYLLYEDPPGEEGAAARNRIRLKGSVLELTKRGGVSTRMVFEPGMEYLTDYATPYGCLKMGILTHALEAVLEESQIHIELRYSLVSDGVPLSDCAMTIHGIFPA